MSSSPSPTRRSRYTFGVRLAAWYAGLFAAGSVVLIALTYLLLAFTLGQRDREVIETALAKYANEYEQGGLRALYAAIQDDRIAGQHETLFVRAIGVDAEAIYLSNPEDWAGFNLARLDKAPPPGVATWSDATSRTGDVLEVASVRLPDGIIFQVGKSTRSRIDLLRRFRTVMLVALLSVILIGFTGAAVITRSALQPIRHLIDAVRRIMTTGRFETRVPARETGDALDELSSLFNAMLDRIEALIAGMRSALDNVAHDLRTPMMRLRGIAESALTADRSPAERREALSDLLEESDRVVAMLNTLMDISEAETGTLKLSREPIRVAQLFDETLDLYQDLAEQKQQTLVSSAPDDLVLTADHNRLRQVMANLVDRWPRCPRRCRARR